MIIFFPLENCKNKEEIYLETLIYLLGIKSGEPVGLVRSVGGKNQLCRPEEERVCVGTLTETRKGTEEGIPVMISLHGVPVRCA